MRFVLITLCLSLIFLISGMRPLAYADWESTLRAHFDIVDTFDNRSNWRPMNKATCSWNELQTGTPGDPNSTGIDWGSYAFKSSIEPANRDWVIYDHGSPYRVGTKSLMLGVEGLQAAETCSDPSPNYTGKQGIGTFKGYFGTPGDTTGGTGYTEIYIFMRVWLPSNSYPTAEEDLTDGKKIFKYVEGQEYQSDGDVGCKKISVGLGFTAPFSYHDGSTDTIITAEGNKRYGDSENWVYLRPRSNGGADRTLGGSLENRAGSGFESLYFNDAWSDIADEYGAIEIYMKLESDKYVGNESGNGDGIFKVWFYKADGTTLNNGDPIAEMTTAVFRDYTDHKFNRLFLHSNHRTRDDSHSGDYYYVCGEGMDCVWYVDDIIINSQRIGEKYFSLLGTSPMEVPSIPKGNLTIQ